MMNRYWTIGAIVVFSVVSFFTGWWMNGSRLEKQYQARQLKLIAEAELARLEAEKAVAEQADNYQSRVSDLNTDLTKLRKELQDAKKRNPMPVECRIDSERMRIINATIDRANAR